MKTTTKMITAALVLAALYGCEATPDTSADGDTWQLYFLGGQSNMEGFGFFEELPTELREPPAQVMIFTGQPVFDQQPAEGLGLWTALSSGHGTGFRTDGETNQLSDRFGPELLFGRELARLEPDARIAIVKYSVGGTALAHGAGYGNWDPDSRDGHIVNQYDHALATLTNALSHTDINGDGRRDRLVPAGIVWMQGEADAYDSPRTANAYQANLKRMMDLLRAALRSDDLPVVIGRITDSGMGENGKVMPYIETVQQAQAAYVAQDACAAYVTVTDSLGYLDDAWHYDTDGFIRLGTAFAEAMHALRKRC